MPDFTLEFDRFRLELGPCACIMGILNATPDSFSDGGRFNTLETALTQGRNLAKAGAHILDIGGESSRPFAEPVSEQEELDRVIPVIEILSRQIDIPISIDTVKSKVAMAALDAGAAIVNDISSFEKVLIVPDISALSGVTLKVVPQRNFVTLNAAECIGSILLDIIVCQLLTRLQETGKGSKPK